MVLPPNLNKKPSKQLEPTTTKTNEFLKYFRLNNPPDVVKSNVKSDCLNTWRLNRFSALECLKDSNAKQAFHVFAFKESLPNHLKSKNSKDELLLMLLDYIKPPEQNNSLNEEVNIKKLYVRLLLVEDFYEKTNGILSQKYDLYCSDEIFSYFAAKIGAKVTLEHEQFKKDCADEIEIYCKQYKDCVEKFKNHVFENVRDFRYVVINTDVPVRINYDTFLFKMKEKSYVLVDSDTIRNCDLKALEGYVKYVEKEESVTREEFFKEFGNYEQIVQDCLNILKTGYKNRRLENILITGNMKLFNRKKLQIILLP